MTNPFTPGTDEYDAWERTEPPPSDEPAPPSYLDRLRGLLVDAADLDRIPDPDPLIGTDILFRDSVAWVIGKPGCKKSFVVLDIAGCVATGEHWQGYPVHRGPVLYLVAEGVRGTKKRVRAWEKAMDRPMAGVWFLPVAVQSKVPAQWDALVELARQLQPALVVIDTQARVTVGVEENSNTDMGEFVAHVERLRIATGACIILIHHTGRGGETGRGASALDGAIATIIRVSADDDRVKLECVKNKDGAEWDDIDLRAVPMGDSIVMAADDGTRRPAADDLRSRRWVHQWWDMHGDEPVSVSVLVKSGVTTETTFHRCKRDLVAQGLAVKEGRGSATRYKLTGDPQAG